MHGVNLEYTHPKRHWNHGCFAIKWWLSNICLLITAPEPSRPLTSRKKFERTGMLRWESIIRWLRNALTSGLMDDADGPSKKSGFASAMPTTGWSGLWKCISSSWVYWLLITFPKGGILLWFSSDFALGLAFAWWGGRGGAYIWDSANWQA